MANAADKVKDPEVIMPRAFLVAIGVTTLLYISLALVLLSDVSALELEKYADTAVAQAASPPSGMWVCDRRHRRFTGDGFSHQRKPVRRV